MKRCSKFNLYSLNISSKSDNSIPLTKNIK